LKIYSRWEGEGINEIGKEKGTGTVRITVNPKYFRPTEVDLLIGNPKKAEEKLKWKPRITFKVCVFILLFSLFLYYLL
jgi:GDPmannose 4,6-dehydratase